MIFEAVFAMTARYAHLAPTHKLRALETMSAPGGGQPTLNKANQAIAWLIFSLSGRSDPCAPFPESGYFAFLRKV